MTIRTVALDLTTARAPPRDFEEKLLERRPRVVSAPAAKMFALLIKAVKPARPFDEEPDFATLANAARWTCAEEWRRTLLLTTVGVSSSMEEEEGVELAFRLPFPLKSRTDINRRLGEGGKKVMMSKRMCGLYTLGKNKVKI